MKITPRKYAQALALMLDTAEKTIIGNFIEVLRQRKQTKMLPKILRAFEEEWLKQRGIKKVDILYPKSFESSLPELEERLADIVGEKLKIRALPSSNLIGGFKIKIDDTLFNASVEGNLAALAKRLH